MVGKGQKALMQCQNLGNQWMLAVVENKVIGFLSQCFLRKLMGHPAFYGLALGAVALHGAFGAQLGWCEHRYNTVQLALAARFENDGRLLDDIRCLLNGAPLLKIAEYSRMYQLVELL